MKLLHEELTKSVIKVFYDVYNELGYGFLEKIYENALTYELRKRGFKVEQQKPIQVFYDERVMDDFFCRSRSERFGHYRVKGNRNNSGQTRSPITQLPKSHPNRGRSPAQLWSRTTIQTQNLHQQNQIKKSTSIRSHPSATTGRPSAYYY